MREVISNVEKDEIVKQLTAIEMPDKERFESYLRGEHINFNNIYIVYSGGDDLVLVGPWETMIIFSIFLNMCFRKYTCNNEYITLSAGLAFVKSKYPIASAIKQADMLLNKSKAQEKNKITLFGTTVSWERMPELLNFFLFLNEKVNDEKSAINTSFLYRLFVYHRMALRYFDEDHIEGLKYISALSYDIGRNIIEWAKDGKIRKGYEEYKMLQKLIDEGVKKGTLMFFLKIPLFWTLYRNRGTRIENDA